jgi:protein-S-isoprenylcysteine O-methyltransferase Ste14
MTGFNGILGSGPGGLFISVALLLLANFAKDMLNVPNMLVDHLTLRVSLFIALTIVWVTVVGWSLRSLDPRLRGKRLVTTGAFKCFRHPLYAAFATFFDFGLAILLNNWVFICWAFLLSPIWQFLVKREEEMLKEIFSNDYENYCEITGRFFPRLAIRK